MNDSKDHKAAAEPPIDCRVGRWIACTERLPVHGQTVAFVARTCGNGYRELNGRVLGGRYSAEKYGGGFSVPGMTVDAWYWMPLPEAPKVPNAKVSEGENER